MIEEETAATKIIRPYAESLFRQMYEVQSEGRRPMAVEVPRSFPAGFDSAYVLGLPCRRADVEEPTVVGGPVIARFDPPDTPARRT